MYIVDRLLPNTELGLQSCSVLLINNAPPNKSVTGVLTVFCCFCFNGGVKFVNFVLDFILNSLYNIDIQIVYLNCCFKGDCFV